MAGKNKQLDSIKGERTLSRIVAEEGTLSDHEILAVIGRLCASERLRGAAREEGPDVCIHPDNILADDAGQFRFGDCHVSEASLDLYMPPELDVTDHSAPTAQVYALGMLMLFMSTGQLRKKEAQTSSIHPALFNLISRCIAFDPADRFEDTDALLRAINRQTHPARRAVPVLAAAAGALVLLCLLRLVWQRGSLQGRRSGDVRGYTPGYSEGYVQGFSDAPGIDIRGASYDPTVGNLPGNYQADTGAVAASDADSVYYLSGDAVCRMDPYTEEVRILAEIPGVRCLQFHDGALFCCAEGQVLRLDPDTGSESLVCEGPDGELSIFENTFYLYDRDGTGYLYRVDPENGSLTQLNGAMSYRCLQVVDGSLYYLAPDLGDSICKSDPDGGNQDVVSSSAYEDLCICGGMIYASTGHELIRMNLSGGDPEILKRGSFHSLNVTDGGIFFLSGSTETLEWLSIDGKTQYTVVPSKTGSFNVAGDWIFYLNREQDGKLWRVRTSGADAYPVTP